MSNKMMSKEEVIEMQREVLKRQGSKFRVVIPYEVVDYVINLKHSNTWKGKYILLYMGVYLTYREAYYTYRLRSMNIQNIMQLMNISPDNRELSSEFSKKGYLSKEKIITHVNDLPISYSKVWDNRSQSYKITYNTANNISKEDRYAIFEDFENRQMRSIEPTLNIKGKTRKRGKGIEILRKPIDVCRKETISFSYETIQKFVSGRMSTNDLWALVVLKRMTGNKTMSLKDEFRVSKEKLGEQLGISENGYKKIHNNLREYFTEEEYGLNQVAFRNKDGELASKVFLTISGGI